MTSEANPPTPEDSPSYGLARDRTSLANERTLLAYLRTAIMLFASGITLVKLFATDNQSFQVLGYMLIPLSFTTGAIGYVRFVNMRRKINS